MGSSKVKAFQAGGAGLEEKANEQARFPFSLIPKASSSLNKPVSFSDSISANSHHSQRI
jgi:hypothetical protein